jgi:hypothetical protein
MTSLNTYLSPKFGPKFLALALICGALSSTALGQSYIFNQAGLVTGNKPSSVAVADLNADGKIDLAVTNESDNTVSVMLTKPDGSYAPGVIYKVGAAPVQVVAADFNGDGKIDLAVVNSQDNTVSVLLGVGDGTFQNQVTYPTGGTPVALTAADFNGDKHIDLAVLNQADGTATLLLGADDGTFTVQSPPLTTGATPFAITGADMNGDGKPDLLVLSGTIDGTANLSLVTNSGNGTFTAGASLLSGPLHGMAVGDFNNDGNMDVAVTMFSSGSVSILLGNGAGTFQTVPLDVSSQLFALPRNIVAGDFNHDGNLDLVVYEYYFMAIYLGKGDGTFQPALYNGIPSTLLLPMMVAGDFNNDGQMDLAAVIQDDNTAVILLGNGDGTLGNRADTTLPVSGGMGLAVATDLNGDRKQDLAVVQFNQPQTGPIQGFITSLLGNGDSTFQAPISSPMADIGIDGTASGDFNGDGNADIATTFVDADGGLAVQLGDGNGMFGAPITAYVGSNGLNLGPIVAGDFNRDGKTDLIVVDESNPNSNSSPMYILLSNGDGTFTQNFLYHLSYGSVPSLTTADFNHDGILDLAIASSNQTLVFLGHGDGTFAAPGIYTIIGTYGNSVVAGDFNGDGKIDMVVGAPGVMLFFAGNGDGTFAAPVSTLNVTNGIQLIAGDFNGDGVLDLIVEGPPLSTSIMLGNGDGTFQAPVPFQGTYYPRGYTVGDFNGDGTMDLVQFGTAMTLGVNPQTATVWSSGPTVSLTASALQFAARAVGASSAAQVISLANAGNASLSFTSIAADGDFDESNTCTSPLAVGKTCQISVTFAPTVNGTRSGKIMLVDNAKPGPQTIALTGWAGPPDFALAATPNSASVTPGGTANYELTLTPGDGFTGAVQIVCTGAPSETSCPVSPQSVTLDGTNSQKVSVSLTTTAASAASAAPDAARPWKSQRETPLNGLVWLAFLCLSGIFALTILRGARRAIVTAALLFLVAVNSGCGGGGSGGGPQGNPGTPAGTYTITLTTTSGNVMHSTTVTLTVN